MEGKRPALLRAARLGLGTAVLVLGAGLGLAHPITVHAVFAGTAHVTPSSITFGSQEEVSVSHSRSVTLANNDVVPLVIHNISMVNGDADSFVVTRDGCGHQVGAGNSCDVEVAFRPAAGSFGPRSSTLEFDFDNAVSPQSITLIGHVASPNIDVEPSDLHFGPQQPGTTSGRQTVTVHNTGSGGLQITDLKVDPTDDFSIVNGDCLGEVNGGGSCSLDIAYSPKNSQGDVHLLRTAVLTINDNDPSSPTQLVALEGTVPSPDIELSTSDLGFGSRAAGTVSPPQVVTVRNSGTFRLTIGQLQVEGLDPDDFKVTGNTCPGALEPGQTCQLSAVFAPEKSDGSLSALVVITEDAPVPTRTIALHGTALPPGATPPPAATPHIAAPVAAASAAYAATPASATAATADPAATTGPTAAATPAATDPGAQAATTTGRATAAAAVVDDHSGLADVLASALANDGSLLRAVLTGLLMALPFAAIAGLVILGRVLWLRRRTASGEAAD
ncbi:MAG TPA: choice-of-anchor D domain-containing protein [Candidatus Dormibacteraeota bacterium]|nr:choice-of-anchor D domain-containing protein [Candidatus Dormibacteraeota bacterium]